VKEQPVDPAAMARYFDEALERGAFLDFDPDEMIGIRRILKLCNVRRRSRIFEPGCGAGRFTRLLAQRTGASGHIDACETAPKMIEAWRKRADLPGVCFHESTAMDVDLPRGAYDLVICLNLWPHLDRVESHLERFAQLLRPEGRLAVAHSMPRENVNAIHGFVAPPGVRAHPLPPADALADQLTSLGWRPESVVDEEIYFVSAGPPLREAPASGGPPLGPKAAGKPPAKSRAKSGVKRKPKSG